jgi:hypothetical protein
MTWKCPACATNIRHGGDYVPSFGMIYRCHICRLELVIDHSQPDKLTLAPMPPSDVPETA